MSEITQNLPRSVHRDDTGERLLDRLARRALFGQLRRLHDGEVVLVDRGRAHRFGQRTAHCPISVTLYVSDPRFYSEAVFGGTIGVGEAYMAGYWHSDDLTSLVQVMAHNLDVSDGMERGLGAVAMPARKLLHWLNRNTRSGSRRNIAAHYDLGNEFFGLMLDETMMYSCAIFEEPAMDLAAAQRFRLELICRKLDLQPTDHLLEIGTGWGGLALHAARHFGCRVTTTTISREQYEYARRRIAEAGLEDRVTVLLEDYRNLTGRYDKLVSIEMIEAVGHEYFDAYFRKCASLLEPGGLMLIQAITIADRRYEQAKRSVDFIQRYIFPGGCLPSVTAMLGSIAAHTDLRLDALEEIGGHYARTLRLWRRNVADNLDRIRDMGYSDAFLRMWEYYLCYCEGGFLARTIGTVHMRLSKPGTGAGGGVPRAFETRGKAR